MRGWSFPVTLDAGSGTPLYQQIASALAADVERGRLRPGARLPGSRALAQNLAVHRATVVAAYAELVAQGWAKTRPQGGTFIAESSPEVHRAVRRRAPRDLPARAGFPVEPLALASGAQPPAPTPLPRGAIALWGGVPDLRLLPLGALGRALRRATRQKGRELLAYSAARAGHPALRAELARMLAAVRGLALGPDNVFVTQGSQMALALTARALVRPHDVVAVEAIGYRPAWAAFERAGADLVAIPVDREGLDVAALAALTRRQRVRAVYVTPQHQYPTTVVLSPRRRQALLALARAEKLAIVEDDYDYEFHYQGRPVAPLASVDGDGQVIYIGSLAKILAPGLRVGFVVAAPNFLDRLGAERMIVDRQGNHLVEAAIAELLEEGEVERHARRARRVYQRRRDALAAALERHLGGALSFALPPGGMALWARAAGGIDVGLWQNRALAAGVAVQIGEAFSFTGAPLPFLRLGFACADEKELELAARRLAESLPTGR